MDFGGNFFLGDCWSQKSENAVSSFIGVFFMEDVHVKQIEFI